MQAWAVKVRAVQVDGRCKYNASNKYKGSASESGASIRAVQVRAVEV